MTSINFILDKSGSMVACKDQTISGFNEFLATQDPNDHFSLTMFDTQVQHPEQFSGPVSGLPKLDGGFYQPDGMTALYDAIGQTVARLDEEFKTSPPERVLIVIQTDGQENSSKEYTQQQIFDLIKERQEGWWQWGFIFLGADQDAYAASAGMGIAAHATVSYASLDSAGTFASVGNAARAYSGGQSVASSLSKTKKDHDVQSGGSKS